MTTLTYPQTTLMAYVNETSSVGTLDIRSCVPYWEGNFVIMKRVGSGSTSGIVKFNIDPDGSEIAEVTKGALTGVGEVGDASGGAFSLTTDGNYIVYYDLIVGQFVTVDVTTNPLSGPVDLQVIGTAPYHMVPVTGGITFAAQQSTHIGRYEAVTAGNLAAPVDVGTIRASGGASQGITLGRRFPDNGVTYAVSQPATTTAACTVHTIVPGSGVTTIGSFLPSNVDATWSTFDVVSGCAYDQTDGHLIMGVETTDVVSQKRYIIKVSTSTGGVLWTCAVNNLVPQPWGFYNSRVQNGSFNYMGSGGVVYHIDTATGVATTETISGFISGGTQQYSDDVSNSIIFMSSYTEGVNPPTYVGLYMGTEGHHSTSGMWHRVWFATEAVVPEVGLLGVSFADFTNDNFLDWDNDMEGVDYESFLTTFYVHTDDEMFWMYSPYCYTYFVTESGGFVVDSNGSAVVDSFGALVSSSVPPSCYMSAKWDWTILTDSQKPKETQYQQVYRIVSDKAVSVTKKKIRGKGRTVQLKYKSQTGRDFQLLGWGLVLNKVTET